MKPEAQDSDDSRGFYENRQLKEIAARWDAKAAEWDRALHDPECHLNEDHAYQLFLRHLTAILEQRREFCKAQGAIDAGCATGLVLAHMLPAFAWGIGVDISPEMIKLARSKQIPRARFVVGDCFNLEGLAPKAGAVVSRGVLLSHYGQGHAAELFRSAKRVLVENGFLICDFLNQEARTRYTHEPANKTYYEPAEVCRLAKAAGFGTAEVLGEPERRVRLLYATG